METSKQIWGGGGGGKDGDEDLVFGDRQAKMGGKDGDEDLFADFGRKLKSTTW